MEKEKSNLRGWTNLILAIGGLVFLLYAVRAQHEPYVQASLELDQAMGMRGEVNELAKRLSIPSDGIELYGAITEGDRFIYAYRLLDVPEGTPEIAVALLRSRPFVMNVACTLPDAKRWIEAGMSFVYHYADSEGRHITTIQVTPDDCATLSH
jgi:hypothetical protein